MKKSEMVKLMWNAMDSYMTESQTEKLLDKMLEAGMLPPIKPDRTVEDLDLGIPRWEEEN